MAVILGGGADKPTPLPRSIMGIDPGSIVTGWGVVAAVGSSLTHVASGTIAAGSVHGQPARLSRIYHGIREVLDQFDLDGVSLEKVFFAHNAQSALKLGQARGVALLAAAENRLVVHEYSSNEIKSAVVGYGHATKAQVQAMVGSLLHVSERMAADAADALAAAICHVHRQTFHARMLEAVPDWRPAMGRRKLP